MEALTTELEKAFVFEVPTFKDERGTLAVVDWKGLLPFRPERIFYILEVGPDTVRGGHAHRTEQQVLIALSGGFRVTLDDGRTKKHIQLERPDRGLFVPPLLWRELDQFSKDAVCLVLASGKYSAESYIRDYGEFSGRDFFKPT